MTSEKGKSFMNVEECKETVCGCFYCIRDFHGSDITEFADKGETALCPLCGVDSVLANVTDPTILQALHDKWFSDTA